MIQKLMKSLGITEEEAREIIEADKAIDKGEKLFELTSEQKQNAKKARGTGTKKATVYNFERKRKECPDKQHLISLLEKALKEECQEIEITNKERELTFQYNNIGYRLTLAVPRVKEK